MKNRKLCRQVKIHLPDIVEPSSDLPQKEFLLSHVKSCPDCLNLVNEFSRLWRQLESPPEIEPSPDFSQRAVKMIEEHEATKFRPGTVLTRLRPLLKALPAAALIVLAGLIGNFLGGGDTEIKKDFSREFVTEYFNNLDEIPSGSFADAYLYLDQGKRRN